MGGKKRGKTRPGPGSTALPNILKEDEEEQERVQEKGGAEVHEIDAIFALKKRKRPVSEEDKGQQSDVVAAGSAEGGRSSTSALKGKKKQKNKRIGESSLSGPAPSPAKGSKAKRQDGLTIYTEEELGFNKKNAGGTPLCPFDCECCF